MYKYKEIKTVHLEITEKCQSGCALCGRYDKNGKVNSNLKMSELTLADCKIIFPKSFIKQLDRMYMCGNFGDPIIASDTLEVFEYFRYSNTSMGLNMHTNGGARNSQWWKDLASLFYTSDSYTTFSIDGLQDTNHIYRRGVVWDNIINAASSYIQAGGNAVWSFIVFKHNEHQVEEARKLSEKMGFKRFVVKKSSRFTAYRKYDYLQPPSNPLYLNLNLNINNQINDRYGSYDNFLDQTGVSCKVKKEKSLYVSAEGLIFPCCWTAGNMFDNKTKVEDTPLFGIIKDFNNINAKKLSMEEILNGNIFEDIEKTWSLNSRSEGKLDVCVRNCSKEYDFFNDQF